MSSNVLRALKTSDAGSAFQLTDRGKTGPKRPRRPPRRRSRSRSGTSSRVAELVEPGLVDSEVMGDLVQHGDPDLALELARVRELLDERPPEDRHLGREIRLLLEEAEQVGIPRILLFDDDRDVLEFLRE